MNNDQNGVDFSNYLKNKPQKDSLPAKFQVPYNKKIQKKKKIQIIVIMVCLMLVVVFWSIYFAQNPIFKKSSQHTMPPKETIPGINQKLIR